MSPACHVLASGRSYNARLSPSTRWLQRLKDIMLEDAITFGAAGDGAWTVAGVLTDLEGALLTVQPGEAGLAGTVELGAPLHEAANDARWEETRS
jgi:hypothetical protein